MGFERRYGSYGWKPEWVDDGSGSLYPDHEDWEKLGGSVQDYYPTRGKLLMKPTIQEPDYANPLTPNSCYVPADIPRGSVRRPTIRIFPIFVLALIISLGAIVWDLEGRIILLEAARGVK